MRPASLNPLFASAQALTGIGPRLVLLLKKCLALPPGVTEPRVIDLLWHMPTGVIDRRAEPQLAAAVPGTIATLEARVLKHKPPPRGNNKAPYKVTCEDDTGRIDLVFFHAERKFIERQLPVGELRFVSGRIERYGDTLQMAHPDYIVAPEARDDLPLLEPVYPLTAGLSGKVLHQGGAPGPRARPGSARMAGEPLARGARLAGFQGRADAPAPAEEAQDVSPGAAPWQRLAYDELLAGQLALALVRQSLKVERGRRLVRRRPASAQASPMRCPSR